MWGALFAITNAILYAAASIFSRRGLENAPFFVLLFVSLAVSTPVFLVFTLLTTGFANVPARGVLYAAVAAAVGAVGARSLYFLGINYLGPGKALSIYATSPIYAAVMAWFVLGETITLAVITGTVAIVAGIVSLSVDTRLEIEDSDHSKLVVLVPLVGAVLSSISVIFRKLALTAGLAPLEAASVNMTVALVIVSPLLLTHHRKEILNADRNSLWNFMIASGIMTVGLVFYFVGLETANVSVFYALIQTQPLFAVIFSMIFLRQLEILSRWTVVSSVMIVIGAVFLVS